MAPQAGLAGAGRAGRSRLGWQKQAGLAGAGRAGRSGQGWQERAGLAGWAGLSGVSRAGRADRAGRAGRSRQGWQGGQERAGLAGAGRAGASLSACCPLESAAPQCTAAQGRPESSSSSFPRQALHPPRSSRACHPGEFLPRERKSLLRREPWAPSSNGLPRRWDLTPRRFPKMWQTEARRLEPGCCVRAPPPAKQHWPGLRGLGGVCLAMYVALLAARRSERLQKLACFGSIPQSPKCFWQGQQKSDSSSTCGWSLSLCCTPPLASGF